MRNFELKTTIYNTMIELTMVYDTNECQLLSGRRAGAGWMSLRLEATALAAMSLASIMVQIRMCLFALYLRFIDAFTWRLSQKVKHA